MNEDLPAATVSYLANPPGRKHAKRAHHKKRRPPTGWSSWKAYMAHIRGKRHGGHVVARANPPKRRTSARKGKRRSTRGRELLVIPLRARRNPAGRRHRSGGFFADQLGNAMHVGIAATAAIGGELGARGIRGLVTKEAPGTVVASAVEIGVALVGGELLRFVNPTLGEFFAVGGVMAPLRSVLQGLAIPWVSSTLGDDGFQVGPGTGVMLVSAHPGDYRDVVGAGAGARALPGGVADYVTGPSHALLQDYVTGPGGQLQDYVTGPGAQL